MCIQIDNIYSTLHAHIIHTYIQRIYVVRVENIYMHAYIYTYIRSIPNHFQVYMHTYINTYIQYIQKILTCGKGITI